MSKPTGLSSLELLITIGIVSMLVALAAPALDDVIWSNRLVTETNKLVRAVHMAKSEAAKHYRETVICPSTDGMRCAREISAWAYGWILFVNLDEDGPPVRDENEPVLASHRLSPNVTAKANRHSFDFHHYAVRSTNGTVIFCSPNKNIAARAVVISYTGRPRVASTRTNGKAYRCDH